MAGEQVYPVYVAAGKDRYLRQETVDSLADRLGDGDQGLACARYDGGAVDIATVLDELRTLPFLSKHRVVVVNEADTFVSENRKLLEKYFAEPSGTGVLILACDTWRSNTNLAKILKRTGRLIQTEPMKGSTLVNWVIRQGRAHDKSIAIAVAQSLIQLAGAHTGRLTGEIEKLSLYVGRRKSITIEDVEQLCGPTAEQSIFAVNDLIGMGKTAQALEKLGQLLRQDRSAEYSLVGVLGFALRRLLKARALIDAGSQRAEVLRSCGIYPGLADRFIAQVGRFSAHRLERLLGDLTRLDHASKTGLGNARINLEKFIVCAASG